MRGDLRRMQRAWLGGTSVVLVACLVAIWTFRFEPAPGFAVVTLADLRRAAGHNPGVTWSGPPQNTTLRLQVEPGGPPVAVRLTIPDLPAVEMLHVQFRMAAHGLLLGPARWADGRMLVEWHAADGPPHWEADPCGTIRGDKRSGMQTLVIRSRHGPAVPAMRFEHLGRAGNYEVTDLTITVVRERMWWKAGRWLLLAAWFLWGVAWVKSWPGVATWRACGAAAVALGMALTIAVPGPWRAQRPIIVPFRIGNPPPAATAAIPPATRPAAVTPPTPGPVPAMGKITERGGWVLLVKRQLTKARPLLHVLLFLGPTLVLAILARPPAARSLAVMLALATESAQAAFGYGFDWIDVLDLLLDGAGILLALRIYHWLLAKRPALARRLGML